METLVKTARFRVLYHSEMFSTKKNFLIVTQTLFFLAASIFFLPQVYFSSRKYVFLTASIFFLSQVFFSCRKYFFLDASILFLPQVFFSC